MHIMRLNILIIIVGILLIILWWVNSLRIYAKKFGMHYSWNV